MTKITKQRALELAMNKRSIELYEQQKARRRELYALKKNQQHKDSASYTKIAKLVKNAKKVKERKTQQRQQVGEVLAGMVFMMLLILFLITVVDSYL